MNYFDSFKQYDYQSDNRRNSNSFNSEDSYSGARQKKPRYRTNRKPNRGGFGGVRNDVASPVVFKEPREPPRRSPAQDRRRDGGAFQNDNYQRSGSLNKAFVDARDMPRFVEPDHSGPQWQWENYSKSCKSWIEKHQLAYYQSRCLALEFENQLLFKQINSLIEENCVFAYERGEVPAMRLPELYGRQARSHEQDAYEGSKPKDPTPSKKRLPEEKERSVEAKKKKVEEDLKKEEEKKKEEGPTKPVSLERKESLDQLYGKDSALIHKLETSVQLNYNRNCDTLKPELWLAVPLNPNTTVAE